MKITKSVTLQNLTRGVLAVSRSHDFRKNGTAAKHSLQGSIRQLLIKAGTQIPPTQYADYINWAEKLFSSLAPGVDPLAAPDYLSLSNLYEVSGADWSKTLAWVEARLMPHAIQLRDFFSSCALVETLAFRGELDNATKSLEDIEIKFGPSIHLVELRLAIAQLKDGIDGQKAIAAKMRGAGKGGLIGLLIYLISIRNENRLSLTSYKEQVDNRADKFRDKHFSRYLKYRLLKEPLTDEVSAASVLQVEENHTIYDLASTASSILEQSKFPSEPLIAQRLLTFTRSLQDDTQDDHENFFRTLRKEVQRRHNVSNLYRALKRSFSPNNPKMAELRVLGLCRATLRSVFDGHGRNLYDKYSDCIAAQILGAGGAASNNEFLKATLNFSCFPASSFLLGEAQALARRNALGWPGAMAFDDGDLALLSTLPDCSLLRPIRAPLAWLVDLQKNHKQEFVEQFVTFANSIPMESIPRSVSISLEIAMAYSYVQLQKPHKVSELISRLVLDYEVRLENLPVGHFYERHSWKVVAAEANLTQTAIALEMFSRTTTIAELDSYKRYAIEDLLLQSKKSVPSQLTLEDCNVSLEQFQYFLNVVCVQKNLDMLHSLKGTVHLDNERKNILSYLAYSDKSNAAVYNAEILSILHKTRIAQGVALIDRSRIHVDEDPLVNKLSLVLIDRWNRYKSLVNPIETSIADLTSILRTIEKSEDKSEVFKVPKNEGASLLLEIVGIAQDAFLNDADHGLDRYLGHRIRHNAFANQVRGGLGESHILTKQVGGQYQESEYWFDKLKFEDFSLRAQALSAMRTFSMDFDKVIEEVNEDMLRVRRQGYPNGIFDVHVSAKAFYLIEKIVSTDSNLPTFISSCFQVFWQLLIPSLQLARQRVEVSFSSHIGMLFSRMLKDISALQMGVENTLESVIVQAKNDTSKAIEQAAKWFNKSAIDENSHVYSVKDAADIVVEACVSSRKGADPQVTLIASGDIEVHAPALYQLSDIFWIIVDNACSHCGMDRGVPIRINIRAFATEGVLLIDARNPVATGASAILAAENIAIIRADIDRKQYSEKLLVEGKSGLKKLAAMALKYSGGKIDFYFENSEFRLLLEVPLLAVYIPEKANKE